MHDKIEINDQDKKSKNNSFALLLIIVGGLLLLQNLGIIRVADIFSMLLKLWPLGLIMLGLLILSKDRKS